MPLKFVAIILTFAFCQMAPVQACPTKAANHLAYQRRDGNRCEGIKRTNVSGSFGLISFASRQLPPAGKNLSLKIPVWKGQRPTVTIQARQPKFYWLNKFETALVRSQAWYQFTWPATVMDGAAIPRERLRAIATVSDSVIVHVPVILGRASGNYEFVFFSANRASVRQFQIERNGQTMHRDQRVHPTSGEIRFIWDARNQPPGTYGMTVAAQIEQRSAPPESANLRIQFVHHPTWLK